MPGRGDDAQLTAATVQDVACGQALAAQPVRRVYCAHRRAGQLGQPRRARRVIQMPVRQHDVCHPLALLSGDRADAAQVRLVIRAGVDHDGGRRAWLGNQPGVRAVQRHQRRVRSRARSVPGDCPIRRSGWARRQSLPSCRAARADRELTKAGYRQPHRALAQLDLRNDRRDRARSGQHGVQVAAGS